MTRRSLRRLASMNRQELLWRTGAAARIRYDHARAAIAAPAWDRTALGALLRRDADLSLLRNAAARRDWPAAHAAVLRRIVEGPQRFAIAPSVRGDLAARIRSLFPDAAAHAARRADRILEGHYDVLGYRGLRFGHGGDVDWHYDPVHDSRAPVRFWSTVPFLDPAIGDHKVIWELNRHQHWLALGRAYWLTSDERYRAAFTAQLASWLRANPPLLGINWASMLELAFRSLSWIWALHFFADLREDDEPWAVDLLVGLDRQLDHVEKNLSYYFSPNTHLLGEALALYVAGQSLPMLASSMRRAHLGRRVLLAEIDRQIAADGGHCERSAHYHRYALDFYSLALIVARICGDEAAAGAFEQAVSRLGFVARLLADSRGRLPRLGDDDGGMLLPMAGRADDDIRDSLAIASALTQRPDVAIGSPPEEAYWLLAHETVRPLLEAPPTAPGTDSIGSAALPETGYYISRSAAGDHLVIDGGPHGYRNAGHAHADALSITLSLRGAPLLIDPGTAVYSVDAAMRDRFRSTALHNTLTIDEQAQSKPDGPFHWTSAAHATTARWRVNAGFDYFEGWHDGYKPLAHRRHILVLHGDLIVVADLVACRPELQLGREAELQIGGSHRADVHWHFDPRWQISLAGRRVLLTSAGDQAQIVSPHGVMELFSGDKTSGLGWRSPVYGRVEPSATLRVSHTGAPPLWLVTVFGLNPANEIVDVETVPVWAEAGTLENSVAFRITRAGSIDVVMIARRAAEAAAGVRGRADATWRVADLETDAHLMFGRTDIDGRISRLGVVDGSMVSAAGRRRLLLALPREVPDVHLDFGTTDARLSGQGFGARVQVAGRDLAVELERRSAARPRAAGSPARSAAR